MSTKPTPTRSPKARLKKALESIERTGARLARLAPRKAVSPAEAVAIAKRKHEARRRPSGLDFVLADRIDFVNPAHWDALATQTVFLSRDYLRVLEAHAPANVAPRYALAYDGGRPVAAMLFQRVQVGGERLLKPRSKSLLDKPIAGLQERLLVCGNLLVWGARGVAFAPDADPALLWHGVGEAMYRLRRGDKLLGESDIALVKDFCGKAPAVRESLRLLGYRSVDTEPDMVLSLAPGWRSFDDYLGSLTSSYRSSARKLLKDCTGAGVTLRPMDATEMSARQHELHLLYQQVHQAQGLRLASLQPGYLPAMAQALGDGFACRVAERDGRAVGFVTAVKDGPTALGYYIGYDRETNQQAPVYLALLQSTIEDALRFGATRLSLGRTALEPKARMGCRPEPLACAARHRVSAVNGLVTALTRTATHDEPPDRSPFKQGA
jgi:hypothetical protein